MTHVRSRRDLLTRLPLLGAALAGCALPQDRARAQTRPRVQMIVGGTSFRGTVGDRHWAEFQAGVQQRSNGGIGMRMLIHGELGSEDQIVSGLRRGRVQFANLSALVASTIVPEATILYAPYLFESSAEADYVLDTYLTPEFGKLFAARGLTLLTWYDLGFQQIWSRKKPILVPADARGVRFRVSASKSAELLGRALQADVIPLGFADIIPSLQTGLIEAGENGVTLYARTGTAPEAPHLTITDHSLALSAIVAEKRWWDRLEPRDQQILREAFPAADRIRRDVRAEIEADLAASATLKFRVYRLTPQQKALWVAATRSAQQELIKVAGGDSQRLYQGVLAAKKAFAARRGAG